MTKQQTTRRHLARRWHGTGPQGGSLTLRCTCGQWETNTGTTRAKEDAHRAHRVAMGETVKPRKPSVLEQLRAENQRLQRELDEIAPRAWCQCCVFGNHTEPCTCAAATCCHPERHAAPSAAHLVRLAVAVDDLHSRLDDIEALCDVAESDALAGWENPLPVPEWAVNVRAICRREPAAVVEEA